MMKKITMRENERNENNKQNKMQIKVIINDFS